MIQATGTMRYTNLRCRQLQRALSMELTGKVSGLTGSTIEVADFAAPVGAQCCVHLRHGGTAAAEVIGFVNGRAVLMVLDHPEGIACGDTVVCVRARADLPMGPALLGRVINANGDPIDQRGPLLCPVRLDSGTDRIAALERVRIDKPIGTGIRAIDTLATCGCGQRVGIFSGPGVGKSVLLGMIARYTSADVNVIVMVGERGREVREFIEKDLGPEGLARSVVVVSTSDEPAPMRIRAAFVASRIAEYFRDTGSDVLLLADSMTRVAMAQRQIGLALGEAPATRGYTPSVFSVLPQLIERCGRTANGSITGFYTVLVEGDDINEPVSDAMRGFLDGHVTLSRNLAGKGHYPAIDILDSISRVMPDIVDKQHLEKARYVRRLLAIYRDIEDLVNIGAYTAGNNPEYDLAIAAHPRINAFLCQRIDEHVSFDQACGAMDALLGQIRDGIKSSRQTDEATGPKAQGIPAGAAS